MIRAVTIDCWGTLLLDSPGSDDRYRRPRLVAIRAALSRAGVATDPDGLERAYERMARGLAAVWRTGRDVPVSTHVRLLLEGVDSELPARLAPPRLAEIEAAYAGAALLAPPAVYPGAAGALSTLVSRGVSLAVISNVMRTPGVVLRQVLDRAGLLASFDLTTFSDECGVRKPDPRIFGLTLERLGVSPHEAVHVGDDPVLDVEGARDAGCRVVQVTAAGHAVAPVKPDAVIADLGELCAALAGLPS